MYYLNLPSTQHLQMDPPAAADPISEEAAPLPSGQKVARAAAMKES